MPRAKGHSSSGESVDGEREVRRRVVKACQRCRLKKCKCDGANPCTRCKSDDAICAYGKHRKSDKIVFRKGYVQMLERQHTQLISGLQEFYRRTQEGESFPTLPHGPAYKGQPLTHKILEALGVLQSDEDWEDGDKIEPFEDMIWHDFQQVGCARSVYDASTTTTSPVAQLPFSPMAIPTAFSQSTIMAKRVRKLQDGDGNMLGQENIKSEDFAAKEMLAMPPMLNTNLPPSSYHNGCTTSTSFQATPQQPHQQHPLQYFTNRDTDGLFVHNMDWAFGCNEDLFNNNQAYVLQAV